MIVTWWDNRAAGYTDIYAQRVQADGQLGGTVVGVAPKSSGLSFGIDGVYPNPSRGGAFSVSFSLASKGSAALEVLDLAGRRVAAQDVASLGPGRHALRLEVGRHLPSGLYFVLLRQGARVRSRRVAIVE